MRYSSFLILVPLALLAGALVIWPSPALPQDRPVSAIDDAQPDDTDARRRSFEGTWQLTQSPSDARRAVERAVERAVAPMSFFIRGIARGRLREGTPIQRRITLAFQGDDRLSVRFGEADGYTTAIGRTEVRTNPEGQRMRVTQRFRPSGQLEQVFETDQGTRWYVYTPTGDGRLHLETTTGSPRMPQAMYFQLDYHRR